MKRSGFTLIELIFVIVIIGVLAAVAVPKFKDLKQSASAASVLKVAGDAYSTIPSSFANYNDLEEDNTTATDLTKLVSVNGKNWVRTGTAGSNGQTLEYRDNNSTSNKVIIITFNPVDRNVSLAIDCTKFIDSKTQAKCTTKLGSSTITETTEF